MRTAPPRPEAGAAGPRDEMRGRTQMARTINRVQLLGRVGADPELRSAGPGASVTRLRVATDRRSAGAAQAVDWHTVVCWGPTAERVCAHVAKGDRVFVSGQLTYRSYDAADGTRRTAAEVRASEVIFLDRVPRTADRDAATAEGEAPAPF